MSSVDTPPAPSAQPAQPAQPAKPAPRAPAVPSAPSTTPAPSTAERLAPSTDSSARRPNPIGPRGPGVAPSSVATLDNTSFGHAGDLATTSRTPVQPAPSARPVLSERVRVVSTAITIVSAALLGFVVWVAIGSSLYHARAQHTAYARFRVALAQGTAPVGPTTDPTNPNAPLLSPGTPVAVLSIPKLHLREVVFEGTTSAVLQNGPGHLRNTPLPGQSGTSEIMGRAATYGGPFAGLHTLHAGDTITVTTGQGTSTYRVLDVRGHNASVPAATDEPNRLILTTAAGTAFFPSGVLRVDAALTTAVQPAPEQLSSAYITPAERPMASQTSAWLNVVLWGQGLVVSAILLAWVRPRWGRWQVWIVRIGVLGAFGLAVAGSAARLLPNLM
jgi:sortase A